MGELSWYEVYDLMAEGLSSFYVKHKNNAGRELFKLCISEDTRHDIGNFHRLYDFSLENPWIRKFGTEWDVTSIDPIHVFASFNYYNIPLKKRVEIINFYFTILKVDYVVPYDVIDFSGIPSPRIDKIVGARPLEIQNEIWEFFEEFYSHKREGNTYQFLSESGIFRKLKYWYGVAFPSVTIFLFWIDSDKILPLDSNTKDFLKINRMKIPTNINSYIKLVDNIEDKFNFESKRVLVKQVFFGEFPIYIEDGKEIDIGTDQNIDELVFYENKFKDNNLKLLSRVNRNKVIDYRLQILAIKPLNKCENKFLKILNEELYFFTNKYEIDNNHILMLCKPYSIYDVENLKININAIAGKNGTGKSTVIELLIIAFNNIAKKLDNKLDINYIENVFLELYVFIDKPYKFVLNGKSLEIYQYLKTDESTYKKNKENIIDSFYLEDFFYSVLLNYSLHGLNENYYGDWLYKLFHKNDAYQTPIVIEPFRKQGNIDVNKQMKLVNSRLLTNLLEKTTDETDMIYSRKLTDYQFAKELQVSVNFKKLDTIIQENQLVLNFEDFSEDYVKEVISKIFRVSKIKNMSPDVNIKNKYESLENIAKLYLFKKIIMITCRYKHYREFFDIESNKLNLIIELKNVFKNKKVSLLKKLHRDKSHITYKIKQVVNFIKHISKYKDVRSFNEYTLISQRESLLVSLDKLSDKIYLMMTESGIENINEFAIPSFFDIEIIMDKNNRLETLSSGEQQLIYVTNSILYHLKNISSVAESNLNKYNCINIILEEIELYFHPDLQRKFIKYLLSNIERVLKKADIESIKSINILFVTHSPFILTDIFSSSLMLLDRDKNSKTIQVDQSTLNLFGANIHDILGDGFFLENTVGEFSYELIQGILDFLNSKPSVFEDENEVLQVILEIGEPFLKERLLDMYEVLFPFEKELELISIDDEIKELERKKELLRRKRINK